MDGNIIDKVTFSTKSLTISAARDVEIYKVHDFEDICIQFPELDESGKRSARKMKLQMDKIAQTKVEYLRELVKCIEFCGVSFVNEML